MKTFVYLGKDYSVLDDAQAEMIKQLQLIEENAIQYYIYIKLIDRTSSGKMTIYPQLLNTSYLEEGKEYLVTFPLNGVTHITKNLDLIALLVANAKEQYISRGGYSIIYVFDDPDNVNLKENMIGYYNQVGSFYSLDPEDRDFNNATAIDDIINSLVENDA